MVFGTSFAAGLLIRQPCWIANSGGY